MTGSSPVLFIRRERPLSTLIQRTTYFLAAGAGAIWVWPMWQLTVLFALISMGLLLWLGFTRIRTFIVNGDGLTVIQRPWLGPGGSFDFFAPGDIRRIRYRSEKHFDSERETSEIHYILDIVTTDAGTLELLKSEILTFDPKLGQKLARALKVPYEEYLEPE